MPEHGRLLGHRQRGECLIQGPGFGELRQPNCEGHIDRIPLRTVIGGRHAAGSVQPARVASQPVDARQSAILGLPQRRVQRYGAGELGGRSRLLGDAQQAEPAARRAKILKNRHDETR